MSKAILQIAPGEHYISALQSFASHHSNDAPWLNALRARGRRRFGELGFPTTRDEEWKYTDVTPIAHLSAAPSSKLHLNGVANDINNFLFGDTIRIVFVDGHFSRELSHLEHLPDGVRVANIADSLDIPSARAHLGQYATRTADETFVNLNTAFLHEGAFVHIARGVVIEEPIQLVFISSAHETTMTHPRVLIVAEENSQSTVIETYAGKSGAGLTNAVTEVVLSPDARVDHYKVQMESAQAFHIGTLQVQAERNANFRSHSITFGARLTRNNANAIMNASGIECTLNGLYFVSDDQHIDNHTTMDHAQPHCNSHEIYTGVLDGRAQGVFNGKIFVRRDAQKTDARQSNRNLLLSDSAVINTKPQLEIFADDVKCTHGATIGQLDEAALFYLRARGISKDDARGLLIYAFAAEVLEGVRVEELRTRLERELSQRLAQSRALHGR